MAHKQRPDAARQLPYPLRPHGMQARDLQNKKRWPGKGEKLSLDALSQSMEHGISLTEDEEARPTIYSVSIDPGKLAGVGLALVLASFEHQSSPGEIDLGINVQPKDMARQ
ncbi:MAG TPA: hypothetical protein VNE40_03870 [Candidatus Dormibacteraeota bacterium]|nr:hypothetical protein [Candidatus Dormibacteraeota bacterium]